MIFDSNELKIDIWKLKNGGKSIRVTHLSTGIEKQGDLKNNETSIQLRDKLLKEIENEVFNEIDRDIILNRKIIAIKKIRESFNCGVSTATEILGKRYDTLRKERSNEFQEDHKSYWKGFYS